MVGPKLISVKNDGEDKLSTWEVVGGTEIDAKNRAQRAARRSFGGFAERAPGGGVDLSETAGNFSSFIVDNRSHKVESIAKSVDGLVVNTYKVTVRSTPTKSAGEKWKDAVMRDLSDRM